MEWWKIVILCWLGSNILLLVLAFINYLYQERKEKKSKQNAEKEITKL